MGWFHMYTVYIYTEWKATIYKLGKVIDREVYQEYWYNNFMFLDLEKSLNVVKNFFNAIKDLWSSCSIHLFLVFFCGQ